MMEVTGVSDVGNWETRIYDVAVQGLLFENPRF